MDNESLINKEGLVNRIVSGCLICPIYLGNSFHKFILKKPSRLDRYRASEIYEEALYDASYNNSFSKEEAEEISYRLGICPRDIKTKLEELNKEIEDLKVALFKEHLNGKAVKQIRGILKGKRNVQKKYEDVQHTFDYITPEGYANMVKTQYLVGCGLYTMDEKRVWPNEDFFNDDFVTLERILSYVNHNQIPISTFRLLCRTEPWRSYWQANKKNMFGGATIDWTDEQKTIILFSNMYDNAYQHPNCPGDMIIEDDDMFDGWMIEERRKSERDRNVKAADNSYENLQGEENFIMLDPTASAKEMKKQAKKIDELNSYEGKKLKEQKLKLIEKHGKIKEQDMPDRQQQIFAQSREQRGKF